MKIPAVADEHVLVYLSTQFQRQPHQKICRRLRTDIDLAEPMFPPRGQRKRFHQTFRPVSLPSEKMTIQPLFPALDEAGINAGDGQLPVFIPLFEAQFTPDVDACAPCEAGQKERKHPRDDQIEEKIHVIQRHNQIKKNGPQPKENAIAALLEGIEQPAFLPHEVILTSKFAHGSLRR